MKTEIMVRAHKLAKEIVGQVGDYVVALSITLKQAWNEFKKGVEEMKADGKTFKFLEDKMVMDNGQVQIEFDPRKVTHINDKTRAMQIRETARKSGDKYFVTAKVGVQTAVIGISEEVKKEIDKQYPIKKIKLSDSEPTHFDKVMAQVNAEGASWTNYQNEGQY